MLSVCELLFWQAILRHAKAPFRNEAEISMTLWRVRSSLKYAILCSCNRVQTGRIGLNHYGASNWMDLFIIYLKLMFLSVRNTLLARWDQRTGKSAAAAPETPSD